MSSRQKTQARLDLKEDRWQRNRRKRFTCPTSSNTWWSKWKTMKRRTTRKPMSVLPQLQQEVNISILISIIIIIIILLHTNINCIHNHRCNYKSNNFNKIKELSLGIENPIRITALESKNKLKSAEEFSHSKRISLTVEDNVWNFTNQLQVRMKSINKVSFIRILSHLYLLPLRWQKHNRRHPRVLITRFFLNVSVNSYTLQLFLLHMRLLCQLLQLLLIQLLLNYHQYHYHYRQQLLS